MRVNPVSYCLLLLINTHPYTEPVHTGWASVHWNATGIPLVDSLGYHWATKRVLACYTGTPPAKLSWNCPTLECRWRSSDYCGLHWNTTEGTVRAHTHTQAHIVKQSSIHASLKWQDGGTTSSKWTGLCKFSFYLGVYCSAIDISSLLQTCGYFNFTLCMLWIWSPLWLFYICGWSSNEISLAQTTLVVLVVYVRGCMLGSDLT